MISLDFMTGWITLITRLSLFFAYLKIKKGQFGYMTRMMRFLILMHVEKWLREMSSIPETDAPIKQALAHGLLLHLKNIYPVFPESLVMLLLSVLDVKTYRDDARLNEWISNRVQELGDRYYPVNKHVKIRYTL